MVLTVSFALSPVIGLCCHRRRPRCEKHRRQLDTSVEASRPHDFAVRIRRIRLARRSRPSHPALNVRDDRDTPLNPRRDSAKDAGDLGPRPSGIFFGAGVDRANQVESAGEIAFYAQA
jgi:hypothetical protein